VAGGTGIAGDQEHLRDPAGLSLQATIMQGPRGDLLLGVLPQNGIPELLAAPKGKGKSGRRSPE